jgi:hypothetical protein
MYRFIGQDSRVFGTPRNLVDATNARLDDLDLSIGVQHVVDVAAHLRAGHDVSAVVRRCMVTGAYVVLMTPPYAYVGVGPDDSLAGSRSGWRFDDSQKQVETCLREIGALSSKYCVALPSDVSIGLDHAGGESFESYDNRVGELRQRVVAVLQRAYSLPSGADYAIVRKLVAQDRQGSTVTSGLLMPSVRNLSIEDLSRIREDNEDSFARMQYALKRYLDGLSEFESEAQFRHLIEEVDHECRSVESDLRRVKRKHQRTLGGMVVTAGVLGVAATVGLVDPGLSTALTAAIGSVSATDILSDRLQKIDGREDLKRSAYWIAWTVQQADNRASRPGRGRDTR